MGELTGYTNPLAPQGRPVVPNPDGSFSTEISITVTDPRINGGKPTNIPSMFGGAKVPQEEAIRRITEAGGVDPETGRALQGFNSIDEAVAAAKSRSDKIGQTTPAPSSLKGYTNPLAPPPPDLGEPPPPGGDTEFTGDMPVMQRIVKGVTGESRREFDYPELPQNFRIDGEQYSVQAESTIGAHGNPLAMAQMFHERMQALPEEYRDIPVEFDAYGNPFVELLGPADKPGQRQPEKFYLNRPGPSAGDISETFIDIGSFVAGGRVGGAVGGPSLAGRVIGTGIGTAGASVAMDKIAQIMGSEQPVDAKRAAIMGILGAGGEVAIPMFGRFFKAIFGSKRMFANGKLTEAGQETFRKANINPEIVTPDFARIFLAEARGAVAPAEAAVAAEAKSLPVPVRMTRGDVSRDVTQQSFEEAAAAGARGEPAKNVLTPFREAQQADLRANLPAIQERLGGGTAQVAEVGQGAATVRTAAQAAEQRSRAAINKAYDAARATDATLPAAAVDNFGRESRRLLVEDGFDIEVMQAVTRRLDDLRRAGQMSGEIKMRAMETWRKRIVRDIQNAQRNAPAEAEALRRLRDGYDGFTEAAIDSALLKGDAVAIELWAKARGMRAAHGRLFGDNKIIAKLIREDVTAEQAANYLLGAGKLGGQAETATAVQAIKAIIGKDSPAFLALKEEAFLRLLKSQPGTVGRDMQPLFSGANFARDLNAAMRNAPTLMREIFTKEEISLLMRFRDTALRATTKVRGAGNPSGTAHELARAMEAIIGRSGRLTNIIIARFGRKFAEESAALEASAAIAKPVVPVPLFPPGLAGGFGAAAAEEGGYAEQLEDRLLPGQSSQ